MKKIKKESFFPTKSKMIFFLGWKDNKENIEKFDQVLGIFGGRKVDFFDNVYIFANLDTTKAKHLINLLKEIIFFKMFLVRGFTSYSPT